MAPAREGAEGAPIARREGGDDRSSRDDVDFFTPRAALVLGVCMVGALFWEEAVELRARAREVVFGEKAEGPVFFAPRRAGTAGTTAHARESPRDGEGGAPAAPRVPAAPFPDEADAESVDDDENPNARRAARALSRDCSNLFACGCAAPSTRRVVRSISSSVFTASRRSSSVAPSSL